MIKLDDRLQKAYDIIANSNIKYNKVADIGCDHGKLALALLQNNICNHVDLIDISQDSLTKAVDLMKANNIVATAYSAYVSDGMKNVASNDIDLAIMCGMGGETIMHILKNPSFKAKYILISPQHNQDFTKKYLYLQNYRTIVDEMVYENGHYYNIILCISNSHVELNEIEIKYGVDNLKNKPPVFMDYIKYQYDKYNKILQTLPSDCSDATRIKNELSLLSSIIKG